MFTSHQPDRRTLSHFGPSLHRHIPQNPQNVTHATPSKSSSSRHPKSVITLSPLACAFAKNTRVYPSHRSRSSQHSLNFELTHSASYDYKLFCISKKPNPRVSIGLRTLLQKHPGGGGLLFDSPLVYPKLRGGPLPRAVPSHKSPITSLRLTFPPPHRSARIHSTP
jgi:hypothetical protein